MILPKTWTPEELERGALGALRAFVSQRMGEGSGPYQEAFSHVRPRVEELFKATDNLRRLNAVVLQAEPPPREGVGEDLHRGLYLP